jgi:hypothetical protein
MYSDAVRSTSSRAEMLRVVGDGRHEHLVVAQPLSMEASEKLLRGRRHPVAERVQAQLSPRTRGREREVGAASGAWST